MLSALQGSCRVVKRFVYGDGDKTNSKKSVPNPTGEFAHAFGITVTV